MLKFTVVMKMLFYASSVKIKGKQNALFPRSLRLSVSDKR